MNVRRTLALVLLCLGAVAPLAHAASPNVVISQVYGGGGNAGATYKNDFIELFNRGTSPVSLTGWSVQYASSAGTTWAVTPLSGTIAPGAYYLVQEAAGTGGTVNLPTPNATGTIAMSGTAAKVALVASTTALTGSCPTAVDMVGYGASNCSEASPTATLSNTTAALRASDGCKETDNNAADFVIAPPAPRNSASPTKSCEVTNSAPSIFAPANPAATVTQDAAPFAVNLVGIDDNSVYVWSATAGTGVASVAVTNGQGTGNVTYTVTLQGGFTGTASFTASLSDNVNAATTKAVNIQVNPNVVNNAPVIFAPANPIATVAQDAAAFPATIFGSDDNGVFAWSATTGTGVSAISVTSGQGTNGVTFSVRLLPGFSGTATFNAVLTDNFNAPVSQAVHITVTPAPPPALDHLVISQVYGGGGNSGATYRNDYVEIYNPTHAAVDVGGWTIQYGSSTGTTWQAQPLGGVLQPGEYYLVGLASGGAVGAALPLANVNGSINLSGTTGKVALVAGGDALAGCPTAAEIVDMVGFGTANCREGGTNAPAPSNTTALYRKNDGFTDTNVNGSDFVTGTPNPRRTTPITEIGPYVLNVDPRNNNSIAPRDASLTVTFTEDVEVSGMWFHVSCTATGFHDDATLAGSGRTYVITPNDNFAAGETCTATIYKDFVRDTDLDDSAPNSDTLTANYTWTFSIATGTAPAYAPDVHLTMGNPTNAQTDLFTPDNYLMIKPELALSYNRDRAIPNWVSWHLADEWVGSLERNDTFRADPQVPAEWYRVTQLDYQNSGFDRGHMVPNADRDKETSIPINQATFLMSNMIPQAPDNNQGPWANLENYLRTLLPANELYIVAGGAGSGGTGSNGLATTIANGKIAVPAQTWKVALVLPKGSGDDVARVTAAARTIAVIMPNAQGIRTNNSNDWQAYLTTVDAVEALTGYQFFSNVPDAIENAIEAGTNGVNPPGVDNQSFSTTEDAAKSFTISAANPNSNALTVTIVGAPSHGTLSGSGTTQTYTPAPDFNGNDSFTFRVSNGSLTSNTATMSISVSEVNDAPIAANDTLGTNEDAPLQFGAGSLTNNDNAGANEPSQTLTVSSVSATANTHGSVALANGVVTYTPAPNYHGPASFTYSVCDNGRTGGSADPLCATATVDVTVASVNDAPSVALTVAASGVEGTAIAASASGADLDGDALSYSWNVTKNGAPFATSNSFTPDDDGTYVMTVVVSDGTLTASASQSVSVTNVAPSIAGVAGPVSSMSLGTPSTVTVSFSDAGAADTHTAAFTWNDGTTSTASCAAGVCGATRSYTAAGIYTVDVLLADDDGGSAAASFKSVIVTDANAGYVTGGGWIDTQAGKGTLVVNARYMKDGLNGNVKFDAAKSGFNSTSLEWLVVTGTTAVVKGTGTIDGAGTFAFIATVNDATPDKFGIRIWNPATNAVVFDTVTPQPLGGGAVTIHTK
jgi:endonuclease G